MSFTQLLDVIGRSQDMISICTMDPAGPPMMAEWVHASDAAAFVARWAGERHVWFAVQPMREVASGRGKSKDVVGVVTLYADIDYASPEKLDGCTPQQAFDLIDALSDVLGTPPMAIVASGHGLQPYWPLDEPVETVEGALLLLRWKALVARTAAELGIRVDLGVYDLPRILRVPGPPNLKYGMSAKTGAIFSKDAIALTPHEVISALDAALPYASDFVYRGVHTSGSLRMESDRAEEYVFTDQEALEHIETYALSRVRNTPWGAGQDYWKVIWEAALLISNFSDMFDEDDLKDMLRQAVSSGHDGVMPDASDEYQIAMGFAKGYTRPACRPNLDGNPFGADGRYMTATRIAAEFSVPEESLTTEVVFTQHEPTSAHEAELAQPLLDDVRRLKATYANQMTMQAATWLWEYDNEFWLPLRSLVLLGGREGVGKSTWTARLIAQVTNGKMHGEYLGKPKSVIIAAAEDSWEVTILPRLVAAGADLGRVIRVDAETNGQSYGLTLPTDVPAMEKLVRSDDVALIVLDPLLGTVQGKLDTHKDSDVRQALAPISSLAHETRCTVIGLIHQNKNQSGDLLTRMMGSRAFAAVARAVLVCAEAPVEHEPSDVELLAAGQEDKPKTPRSFLFGQLKNNLGPRVDTSVRYEIEGAVVGKDPDNGKPIRTSKIKVTAYGAREDVEETVMAKEKSQRDKTDKRRAPDGNAMERCKTAIHLALLDGPKTSAELKKITSADGFSEATHRKAAGAMELNKAGPISALIYSLPSGENTL